MQGPTAAVGCYFLAPLGLAPVHHLLLAYRGCLSSLDYRPGEPDQHERQASLLDRCSAVRAVSSTLCGSIASYSSRCFQYTHMPDGRVETMGRRARIPFDTSRGDRDRDREVSSMRWPPKSKLDRRPAVPRNLVGLASASTAHTHPSTRISHSPKDRGQKQGHARSW